MTKTPAPITESDSMSASAAEVSLRVVMARVARVGPVRCHSVESCWRDALRERDYTDGLEITWWTPRADALCEIR